MIRLFTTRKLVALCLQVTLVGVAAAAPVTIDKTQSVSGPRSDAGAGLCGSATHFASGQPLSTKADAVTIADKPTSDAVVLGRTTRLFDSINLRNGQPSTAADFTPPLYPDSFFPYSTDASAMPVGTDSNFTLRLRGYFNVPTTLAGKTISFGLNCDDFCTLRIGTTELPAANQLISGRIIKQVTFSEAGLYPVELIYFQNGSNAYLELARSTDVVDECPNNICQTSLTDGIKYPDKFKPVAASELFSSLSGTNTACQECGLPSGVSCATGSYCGDGLCQACNNADHCGTGCKVCPASARTCSNGACVACTADAQCASGQTCNVASGSCVSPTTEMPSYGGGSGGCTLGGRANAARGSLLAGLLLAFAVVGLRRRRQPTA